MRALMTVCLLGLTAAFAQSADFDLNGDNTKVTFVGSKPQGKHEGGFKKVSGKATIDGKDVATLKITLDIDMTSTYSDNEKLTNHLKSNDFFGVKSNPKAKFVSTKVEKNGDDCTVTGKLTLAGKTKELSFPAKVEANDDQVSVISDFKINRHDWGISYGKGKIDDDVSLSVKLLAKK